MSGTQSIADPLSLSSFNPLPLVQKRLPSGRSAWLRQDQSNSVPVRNAMYTVSATKMPASMQCFDSAFQDQPFVFDISKMQIHSLQSIQAQFTITSKEAGAVTHSPAHFYFQRIELWVNDQIVNQAILYPLQNFYGLTICQEEEQLKGYGRTCAFSPVNFTSTNTFAATDSARSFILPLLVPGLDRSSLGLAFLDHKIELKFVPQQRQRFTEVGTSVNSPLISNFTLVLDGVNCVEQSDMANLRSKWMSDILVRDNRVIIDTIDYLAVTDGVTRNDLQLRQTGSLSHAFCLVQPSGTVGGAAMYQSEALRDLSITDSAGTDLLSNRAMSADFIEHYLLNKLFVSPMSVDSSYPVYAIICCSDPQTAMVTGTSTGAIKITGREKIWWTPAQTGNRQLTLIQYFTGGLLWSYNGVQWVDL